MPPFWNLKKRLSCQFPFRLHRGRVCFCSGEPLQRGHHKRDTTKRETTGETTEKGHHKRGTTEKGHHKRDTTEGDNIKGTPQKGHHGGTPQKGHHGGTTQKGHHKRDTTGGTTQKGHHGGTTQKGHHKRNTTGGTTGDNGGGQQGAPCISINQFSQLFKMMKIHMFVILNLYTNFQYENIMTTKICYDKMNVFIQNLQEIGTSTLSKMLKTLNAPNFLNIYWNILILDSKWL